MGDVLTLIEKAEEVYETEQAEEAAARLLEGRSPSTTSSTSSSSSRRWARCGIMGMLPGMPKEVKDAEIDDDELGPVEAIIRSMTVAERIDPKIIDGSRRPRIADGSGTSPNQVNQLIKQFRQMQQMMRKMGQTPAVRAKGRKGSRRRAPHHRQGRAQPQGLELPGRTGPGPGPGRRSRPARSRAPAAPSRRPDIPSWSRPASTAVRKDPR